jgi:multiple antibiotic resistance protein
MPVFMSMTNHFTDKERRFTASKAILVSFFSLVAFAFSGQLLFKFFGISVDSFRVVGGIIFFMMGWDMLNARLSSHQFKEDDQKKEYLTDISVTPLAIPMITGPGAITNSIVLMEDANSTMKIIILIGSIFLICSATYLILLGSSKIIKVLGNTGNKILMRLMGLIVMVIAVEFFLSGLRPILKDLFYGLK